MHQCQYSMHGIQYLQYCIVLVEDISHHNQNDTREIVIGIVHRKGNTHTDSEGIEGYIL